MANTFRGYAQIAGVSGTITAPAAFYLLKENMKLTHNFEEDIIKDDQGNDAAWRAFNEKRDGDIGMRLVSTGGAYQNVAAIQTMMAQLTPYQKVTISGCSAPAFDGDWQVVSGSDTGLTNTTAGSMTWKLRRYVDTVQNALANTVFTP